MVSNLFNNTKLFARDSKEFRSYMKQRLGIKPKKIKLYKLALLHRSASKTGIFGQSVNNERLEYLGDAVLSSVVADFLFNRYPLEDEGFLTMLRAKLVNRTMLSELAEKIGLHNFITSRIRIHPESSVYGDALEALIGAIYLDKGYNKTRNVIIKKIYDEHLDFDDVSSSMNNFKSILIEWGQKCKKDIKFDTDKGLTKGRKTIFSCTVVLDGKECGKGKGSSKKEAQQNAAQNTLFLIEMDAQKDEDGNSPCCP
ncbi:MAG: ribonuclease III [Bacteroidales bacterium]